MSGSFDKDIAQIGVYDDAQYFHYRDIKGSFVEI